MFGSATWTRTRDPMINSHLLYRLSYRGTELRYIFTASKSVLASISLAIRFRVVAAEAGYSTFFVLLVNPFFSFNLLICKLFC